MMDLIYTREDVIGLKEARIKMYEDWKKSNQGSLTEWNKMLEGYKTKLSNIEGDDNKDWKYMSFLKYSIKNCEVMIELVKWEIEDVERKIEFTRKEIDELKEASA